MARCPVQYVAPAVVGMLVMDKELAPMWSVPPLASVVPADPKRWPKRDFCAVVVALRDGKSRSEIWTVVKEVCSKLFASGLLDDLMGLQVTCCIWAAGPESKRVLRVCVETHGIPRLLAMSVDESHSGEPSKGATSQWWEAEWAELLRREGKGNQ